MRSRTTPVCQNGVVRLTGSEDGRNCMGNCEAMIENEAENECRVRITGKEEMEVYLDNV